MATAKPTGGINVNGISKIEAALSDYITSVKTGFNKFNEDEDKITDAVRGENVEVEVKAYIADIQAQFINYINKLDKYKSVLTDMKHRYVENDGFKSEVETAKK